MDQLKADLRSIESPATFDSFIKKYGLGEAGEAGSTTTYVGSYQGHRIEVTRRWWDRSHAFAIRPDRNEVVLYVGGLKAESVRYDDDV